MKLYWAVLAGTALLAGCGESAPAPQLSASASIEAELPVVGPERRILTIGDSLFAGYGLDRGESYPARLEAALRARGINARIANAAVSGDTSAQIRGRLAFALDNQPAPPELVVVELGGNDMLRAVPPEETRANLDAVLAELKRRKLKVLVMGLLAAPNLGADYRARFDPLYPELAKKYGAALVPFFLQAVVGKPELVQADHVHPTAPGIDALVADTVDEVAAALP
ncbi:MAG: arylesterase [Novosphingobium sp.]